MARQDGIIKFKGTIGDITFYRTEAGLFLLGGDVVGVDIKELFF